MAKNAKGTANEPQKTQRSGKKGGIFSILTILLVIVILTAVFGGVFFFIVKNNIGGVNDKYYEKLKGIPLINLALPAPADPQDPKNLTPEEIRKKYQEYRAENEALKKQLADAQAKVDEYKVFKDEIDTLKSEADNREKELDSREKSISEKEVQLKDQKKAIDEIIAGGDKEAFKTYFETLDPENASLLYAQVVKDIQTSAETKKFAGVYAEMDPAAAAKIFEQLGTAKIDMTAETLKAMPKESSAKILESMTAEFAAKVTERLNVMYKGN